MSNFDKKREYYFTGSVLSLESSESVKRDGNKNIFLGKFKGYKDVILGGDGDFATNGKAEFEYGVLTMQYYPKVFNVENPSTK